MYEGIIYRGAGQGGISQVPHLNTTPSPPKTAATFGRRRKRDLYLSIQLSGDVIPGGFLAKAACRQFDGR